MPRLLELLRAGRLLERLHGARPDTRTSVRSVHSTRWLHPRSLAGSLASNDSVCARAPRPWACAQDPNVGFSFAAVATNTMPRRKALYMGTLSKLRQLMICRMAKPEEVRRRGSRLDGLRGALAPVITGRLAPAHKRVERSFLVPGCVPQQ